MYNLYNYEKFWGDLFSFDIQQIESLACVRAWVEFKHFDNLYCKQQKLALVFETELLN